MPATPSILSPLMMKIPLPDDVIDTDAPNASEPKLRSIKAATLRQSRKRVLMLVSFMEFIIITAYMFLVIGSLYGEPQI